MRTAQGMTMRFRVDRGTRYTYRRWSGMRNGWRATVHA
jgi:hypothetical protein